MPHPPHHLPLGAIDTGEFSRADEAAAAAVRHLGPQGRCYGSMSGYRARTADHLTVKNANICTVEHGKIWWGDCDVTVMVQELRALARELGVVVYVLRESAARFATADAPRFDEATYSTDGTDTVVPTQSWVTKQWEERQRVIDTTPGHMKAWWTTDGYSWTLVDERGVAQPISRDEARAEYERRGRPWPAVFDAA
jgi:hypothetical protein